MIYNNKHVVFEQVGVNDTDYQWNSNSSSWKDDDGLANNYSVARIRVETIPLLISYLSSEIQSQLVSTTVQTAKNGNGATLISTTDKLFLFASKEIGYTSNSVSIENNALTTWQYWTTHTTSTNHIKYDNSNVAKMYFTRSPRYISGGYVCGVDSSGSETTIGSTGAMRRVATCFAW